MNDHLKSIRSVVADLETIQQQIGKSQVYLLNVLTDDSQDEWDSPAQTSLLKLETVQRTIGEIQVMLVEVIPVCGPDGKSVTPVMQPKPPAVGPKKQNVTPTKDTSTKTPEQLLALRGIKAKPSAPLTGLDGSADRAALLLGEKFSVLEPFYRAIKRRIANRAGSRWFDVSELPQETRNEIYDFGNRLNASGFFTEFTFFSKGVSRDPERRPVILFDPLREKRVKYFFEGGWLERYALQIIKKQVEQSTGIWCEQQFARGVHVEFPDGGRGEFDVLVSLPGDLLLWLECKTGKWQDYINRFKLINEKFLKIPREHTALVLVHVLDAEDKASASDLTGMTVIHFSELSSWLERVLTA